MKVVILRRIVPNLYLDLNFNKMKICGVSEKLHENQLKKISFCCLFYSNQHVLLLFVTKFD